MPRPLSLEEIQIPAEDANKPAEVDLSEDGGDEGIVDEVPNTPVTEPKKDPAEETPEGEDKPDEDKDPAKPAEGEETPPAEDAKPKEGEEDDPEKGKKVDDPKKPDGEAAPLTEFHKHPDWIKMQDELKTAKEKLEKLEIKPGDDLPPIKTAEERMREKVESGWAPKDRVEEIKVFNEFSDAEKSEREERATTIFNQTRERIAAKVDSTFEELGVTDEDQQNKISEYVQDLRKRGVLVIGEANVGEAIKFAHEQLQKTGQLETKTDPTPPADPADPNPKKVETADQKAAREADEAKKKDVNKKITKPNSSGEGGNNDTPKKNYNERPRSMEDIVEAHRKNLG